MKSLVSLFFLAFVITACEKGKTPMSKNSDKTDSPTAKSDWKTIDPAEAAKTWAEFRTPGEIHKILAQYEGEWIGETNTWIEENGNPISSKSECTNKMILGGRYQITDYKGNVMGRPFEVMKIMGYDNAKKKFVSTLIDNMGTGFMQTEGEWDPAKKSINFKGKMPDPIQPGKECEAREVYTFVDDNNHTVEIFGPDPKTGKVIRTMEVKFTRK